MEASPHAFGEQVRRSTRWLHSHSIRVRLYSVFALILVLVIGLGVFGFARLSEVNRAAEIIRNHWLRDTRVLGDLSNYMSDYRTAEATRLLASTTAEVAASKHEMAALFAAVAASQRSYESTAQDSSEERLYTEFANRWTAYLTVAAGVIELANAGEVQRAVTLYNSDSHRAFDAASDILSRLTEQTVVKARQDSERAASTYSHARDMIVAAMLLAVMLLLGVIVYIARSILAPLMHLIACMHRLAGQHTELQIPGVQRADEIGEMAHAIAVFRDNAVALAASQRRLIEQAAALEEGLENERRLTAQQRDFVSMTSHEFRTPLTVIDGHAQRLIKTSERLDATDIAERGASIRRSVQRITNIMDSLLGASRMLDGHAVFQVSDFDPAALLRDASQAHRDATRGAVIEEDLSSLPARMTGDPKLLFHAFSNLLSNAIKYSPEGSPIEVSAVQELDWLVVKVRDHGIGIPAKDRSRLFERYFRGSNATGVAGTGVGLHLVALVVALHQGEVYAESLEGVGSRFVVRLPLHSRR